MENKCTVAVGKITIVAGAHQSKEVTLVLVSHSSLVAVSVRKEIRRIQQKKRPVRVVDGIRKKYPPVLPYHDKPV